MSSIEKRMVSILSQLKQQYGVTGVKASLEAEGVRLAELLRLKEIAMLAGVGLVVKIGGCEALTDIRLAHTFGANGVMGPMIESKFALEKFLAMGAGEYSGEELEDVKLSINIETVDGYEKIDKILAAENIQLLSGIVLGRTDLADALKTADVDSPEILRIAKEIFGKAKQRSLSCLIGGGINNKTVPFLKQLGDLVDGFETRKVIFGSFREIEPVAEEGIRLALEFEYSWYELKQQYYSVLRDEDAGRMKKMAVLLNK